MSLLPVGQWVYDKSRAITSLWSVGLRQISCSERCQLGWLNRLFTILSMALTILSMVLTILSMALTGGNLATGQVVSIITITIF